MRHGQKYFNEPTNRRVPPSRPRTFVDMNRKLSAHCEIDVNPRWRQIPGPPYPNLKWYPAKVRRSAVT